MKLKSANSKVIACNENYIVVNAHELNTSDVIVELFNLGYVVKNSTKSEGLIKKDRLIITFEIMSK